ncbi:DUF4157 domain-containing protein [Corallococcus sp. AB050B]|nr:DUF4157 domain-containing protein [Corallococcus sp. AB050B]
MHERVRRGDLPVRDERKAVDGFFRRRTFSTASSKAPEEQAPPSSLPSGFDFSRIPLFPPAATPRASAGAGVPLSAPVRAYFEERLGSDFSRVRIHTGPDAHFAARALHAKAFTSGYDIVFGEGRYAPNTTSGRHLLAHELTHVVQQQGRAPPTERTRLSPSGAPAEQEANQVVRALAHGSVAPDIRVAASEGLYAQDVHDAEMADAGVFDAGESLPGGVPPTAEELSETRQRNAPVAELRDDELGPALESAQQAGDTRRYAELLAQIRDRDSDYSFGIGLPFAIPRGVGGNALVTPEVAVAILENVTRGRPPFRPELGVGGCSWFVTEGSPHTGVGSANSIPVQAELVNTEGAIRFEQAQLDLIFAEEEARARPEVEAQVRERFRVRTGRDAPPQLSKTLAERVARQLRGLAERRMWERVAAQVRASKSGVGEVSLVEGGRFSANPGRFTVIAQAAKIRLRDGLKPLLKALRASAQATVVPALEQSAEELARSLRLAGRVRQVFRVGGRILIVVAIAVDALEIIIAEDHLEAALVSLSGWAGAAAASAAFSAFWTPADVAGPWAWAGHGVGMLVSGGIGYWVGSSTTRYIYRLVVHHRGQIQG